VKEKAMRCEDATTRIDAYAAGELQPALAAKVAAHVESCEACRQSLERLKRLVAVLGQASIPPVPDGFAARLMAKARSRHPAAASAGWNPLRWWRLAPAPMHAAAAAVLVIGLAVGLLMGWTTLPAGQAPPAQATVQADPLDAYNLDYLGDAPSGSLADGYLALVSSPAQEGK
jgi:anti-sigma factor RsiW